MVWGGGLNVGARVGRARRVMGEVWDNCDFTTIKIIINNKMLYLHKFEQSIFSVNVTYTLGHGVNCVYCLGSSV